MTERLILSLSYALPGAVVGALALQAAVSLSALYTGLKIKAAEQQQDVPPLAALYFRNTVRVLFVTAVGYMGLAAADAIVFMTAPATVWSRVLGYGSGMLLLVCGFALLVQSSVDRHLKLLPPKSRIAHLVAGLVGVLTATGGMMLVTWKGGIWWP
ncbi:MAG: hypothetical protein KDB90_04870 [Planctomycetes bacterium]|nr:hypothetical protein [Planctomycetota bacterium]